MLEGDADLNRERAEDLEFSDGSVGLLLAAGKRLRRGCEIEVIVIERAYAAARLSDIRASWSFWSVEAADPPACAIDFVRT